MVEFPCNRFVLGNGSVSLLSSDSSCIETETELEVKKHTRVFTDYRAVQRILIMTLLSVIKNHKIF